MSALTLKIKNLKLTDKILLGTIGSWFFATAVLLVYLRFNWESLLSWLIQ